MPEIEKHIDQLEEPARGICLRWDDFIDELTQETSWHCIITETRRSAERQKEMVAAGKSSTMKSKHLDGLAWDFAIIEGGKMVVDGEDWRYTLCGLLARALGAHWPIYIKDKRKDADHIEVRT